MADEEALVTQEAQAPAGGTQDAPSDSQEPNWQVLFEESEANRLKVENDLRSEKGRRTRDQALQELAEDVGGLKQLITAVANRTASGDTDALTEDIANISQTSAQTRATRAWNANYSEAEAGLGDVVLDDNGDVILSKDDIATLTPLWQKAQTGQDLAGLYRVINQANKMVRAAEKRVATEALQTQKEEAIASKKASDRKHGIGDLSVGPSASGPGERLFGTEAIKAALDADDSRISRP